MIGLYWKTLMPLFLLNILLFFVLHYLNTSPYVLSLLVNLLMFYSVAEKQEKFKAQRFVLSLPISRSFYVLLYYVFIVLYITLLGLAMWGGYELLHIFSPDRFTIQEIGSHVFVYALFIIMLASILIPLLFRFKPETIEARIVVSLTLFIFIILSGSNRNFLVDYFLQDQGNLVGLSTVCIASFVVSFIISKQIMEKKVVL
ncbi:ABC-2 transporter permease [Paraliobacillus salinarum]|uniref:ABC-2 transporter permease n=1 Tax=Paraliobacillus salinarum TaxID=1158996 RepID=UPI0024837F27|nr:ABC-2 transporter permease [Paraliobacillus salinarum]